MLVLRLAEQYGNCRDDPHERKLPIFLHSILPNRNPIRSRRQGGTNRALLHIPKNWLNGIITADPLRGFVNNFMRTTLVSHGNILVAPVIGWVLCAPKYLIGTMSLGEAAQAVAAFVMVQTALNWLVDNYPGLAECLSSVNRVGSLLVALDELDRDDEHQVAGVQDAARSWG